MEIEKQIEELNLKVDLLFSVLSNDFLSKQAVQVFNSIQERRTEFGSLKKEEVDSLEEVSKKAIESYKFHLESLNDTLEYYSGLFSEKSNKNINDALIAANLYTPQETEQTSQSMVDVETKASRTSEKSDG